MKISFDQYIINPMGTNNSVFSNREMYRQMYTTKFNNLLVRENGKIDYKLYVDDDIYFVHIKIPSEAVKDFYYDTVLQFYPLSKTDKMNTSLKNYGVKFFSNDPSFVFTFGHAMITNKLFIMDLIPKMSKESINTVAKVKNPKNEIGYVKSLYFAYLTMQRYKLFDKIEFKLHGRKYNKRMFLSTITSTDKMIFQRQQEGKAISKKKKTQKANVSLPSHQNQSSTTRNSSQITSSKTTRKISNTKRTNTSRRTKTI